MNSFLLFAPSFLDKEQFRFVLPDRVVNLIGLYPLYDSEISVYDRIGLKDFLRTVLICPTQGEVVLMWLNKSFENDAQLSVTNGPFWSACAPSIKR